MKSKKVARKIARKVPTLLVEPFEGETETLQQYRTRQTKERMLEALRKHLGVITYACREVGVARKTHYEWMKLDPDYRESVEEVVEDQGDFVERKMLEAISDKQPAVMIFYAKTRLRNRGYVERYEHSGPDGGEIRLSGDLTIHQARQELPPEAITDIVQRLVGSSGRAEEALARLTKHGNQAVHGIG